MEPSTLAAIIISAITVSNIVLAGIVVFIERRDIGSTWAWLMILFFIPVLGFVVYIFLGRQLKKRNFYRLSAEERSYLRHAAREQLMALEHVDAHQAPIIHQYADLIRMNIKSSNALLTTDNEIAIYADGKAKFDALFEAIRNSRHEINIQYYIIQPDALGRQLRDELTRKAKQGVKVRLLFDEIGSRRISRSFFRELIDSGGEVEAFFPSLLRVVNFRINNRNHRKLCIVDGTIAFIGGFNVGNEYIGLNPRFGYWRDTHFKITGRAVDHIQGRFLLDWKQATNQEETQIEQFAFRAEEHHGTSPVQILASGPNSATEHLKNMYIKLILSAKRTIYMQSPYFIPDASFMDACKIALLSGVDVRIMLPSIPDHPFVMWASWAHAGELLNYGAKILLYENGFLHAKTIVVDQEVASSGTMNVDTRSFRLNFEVNAVIYDEQVARSLHDMFIEDSARCSELTIDRYNRRSWVIKFKEAISRLLSPIL